MSLASRILARTRAPSVTLRLDGRRVAGVLSISQQWEFGQGMASATVVLRDPPVTPTPGMAITWSWGYDGFEVPGFTGFVVTPEQQSYPRHWSLQCADVLWRAQREEQTIATSPLNDISAQDAITSILATYAGITRLSIPAISLTSGGPAWTLGTLTPVQWERATALAACQEIAATAGYWLYADAGGTVRARPMERKPSQSPFRILTGGDAAGATLLVQGAPTRRQDGSQVRNRITVRGANTGVEGAQLVDTYLATHALYPGVTADLEYQSFLLEVIDDVTAVAERLAGLWNRRPNTVTARIKADPRLAVGTTVAIQDADIGYSSAQPFFIYSISTTYDARSGRFDQQLTLDGGIGDAGYTTIPAPVAVLSYTLETETLDGTAVTVVTLDGAGSYSQSGGVIVSWQFSTPDTTYGGTPSGSSSPHARPSFQLVFADSASPVDVTLTVTDTSSKTDTVTITIALAGETAIVPTTETISIAFGAAWELTQDGGATWRAETASGNATRVPPIGAGVDPLAGLADAATFGALATRASGSTGLRQTLDGLATASTTLASLGGQITALSVNARNARRVWAAVGDDVYYSTDGGATFTAYGTPAAGQDVRDIIEDPALDFSVFCLAGADMYQALGSPVWGVFYAGPAGATARWMQRSRDGTVTWICYTGTFSGSPLQRVEGPISVSFPVVTPAVSEIRTIALMDALDPAAPTLVATDQENRIWTLDGLTGLSVTQSAATYPAGSIVQHAQQSYQAPLVYLADFDSAATGTGAVRKFFPKLDSLLLFREGAAGRQAHMVGLASRNRSARGIVLRIPLVFASGTSADQLWICDTGVWSAKALPELGQTWTRIVANPFNYRKLLLMRWTYNNNRLWYSDDFGDSWTSVYQNLPFRFDQGHPALEWSDRDPNAWISTRHTDPENRLIRGTNASYTEISTGSLYDRFYVIPGIEDDVFFVDANNNAARYFNNANTVVLVNNNPVAGFGIGDRERAGRGMAIASGGLAAGVADYRSGVWATISGAVGSSLAFLADGSLVMGGRSGVQRVTNPLSSPSASVEGLTGQSVFHLRTDRQTRTLAAAMVDTLGDHAVRDLTGTWTMIPAPAGVTFTGNTANWIEIINAGD